MRAVYSQEHPTDQPPDRAYRDTQRSQRPNGYATMGVAGASRRDLHKTAGNTGKGEV